MNAVTNNSYRGFVNSDGLVEITVEDKNYLLCDPAVAHIRVLQTLQPVKDHPSVLTIVVEERRHRAPAPVKLAIAR